MEMIQGLRKLRIEKGELESVPRGLAAARHLSILRVSENPIKALRGALSMPNLLELDLSHNSIETVDEDYLSGCGNLRRLILSRNNVRRLPPNMFEKTKKVKTIKLRNNSLDSIDHQFHELLSLEIKDIHDLVCAESRNPFVARKTFVSLRERDLCPEMVSRATTYLLGVLGLVAMTLALLSTYLYCKRNIYTRLRARCWGCFTCCTTEDELDEKKLFDVFVSYSSKDQDFVHDNILPILEAHGISYCTYERNFKGGFLLQDIIRDAVACSRRTLLVPHTVRSYLLIPCYEQARTM
ncbi:hypothetical protein MTO96_034774 [Rhipicephalus appendiculatus]